MGQGCSQIWISTRKLPRECFKRKFRVGSTIRIKNFSNFVFSVSYPEGRGQEEGWGGRKEM